MVTQQPLKHVQATITNLQFISNLVKDLNSFFDASFQIHVSNVHLWTSCKWILKEFNKTCLFSSFDSSEKWFPHMKPWSRHRNLRSVSFRSDMTDQLPSSKVTVSTVETPFFVYFLTNRTGRILDSNITKKE